MVTVESPFTIAVYDKAFQRQGWVGDPLSVVVTPRHNQQPTGAFTVASDHRRLPDLVSHGARVVIEYDDQHLMSGMVRLRQGTGPGDQGTVTLQVIDHWRLLTRVLGWSVPGAALTAQTSEYDTRTGDAESVVHALVQANAIDRLGLPVTLATNQHRGGTVTVPVRFHPLADRLLPAIDQAGIGVTVRQSGVGFLLDCYAPATYPRTLTEASGVVQEWSWSEADPEATRVVGGADGEGTARKFRPLVDGVREDEYGDLIEVFRDANDVRQAEAGWESELDARMQETLEDAAPKAGLSVKLAETSTFRYDPSGVKGVRVGDRVRIGVGAGVVVEDVLREATLSWTVEEGLQVTPTVGERTDDPDRALVGAVGRLARAIRNRAAGR